MAKFETTLKGDFQSLLNMIENGILNGSASASYEDGSNCDIGNIRCAVRVYERYSMMGSNRVSLNITVLGCDNDIFISAITSGGSQAVLFKINTIGEETFLDCLIDIVDNYKRMN